MSGLRAIGPALAVALWGSGCHRASSPGELSPGDSAASGDTDSASDDATGVVLDLVRSVHGAAGVSCALLTDGSVDCWGEQAERFEPGIQETAPVRELQLDFTNWCSLSEEGRLSCEDSGLVPADHVSAVEIRVNSRDVCARDPDGKIFCLGTDSYGELSPPDMSFVRHSLGGSAACGLDALGLLDCWGSDSLGMSTPPSGVFVDVSVGGGTLCAIRADSGQLECWGADAWDLDSPPDGAYVAVGVESDHACAIATDGTVACGGTPSRIPRRAASAPWASATPTPAASAATAPSPAGAATWTDSPIPRRT